VSFKNTSIITATCTSNTWRKDAALPQT